jgi:hypothetical protein
MNVLGTLLTNGLLISKPKPIPIAVEAVIFINCPNAIELPPKAFALFPKAKEDCPSATEYMPPAKE